MAASAPVVATAPHESYPPAVRCECTEDSIVSPSHTANACPCKPQNYVIRGSKRMWLCESCTFGTDVRLVDGTPQVWD